MACKHIGNMWVGIALLLQAGALDAHEVQPALLKVAQVGTQAWSMEFKQPVVQGRFLNLEPTSNCSTERINAISTATLLHETYALDCADESLNWIAVSGIERTLVDAMVTVEDSDGQVRNYLITASSPRLELAAVGATSVPVYLLLGVEHLVFGMDHVLFVLLLFYIVRGWLSLVQVITSFTVAHSITLGLSAFDVIRVSQSPVEVLIALSIVMVAYEAVYPEQSLIKRQPWLVAFLFGLLHGLGFAGALRDIGLPDGSQVMALFLFNAGIELGQLGILLLAVLLVVLFRRFSPAFLQKSAFLTIYAVGGLAAYWFIDRTFQFLL